MWARVSEALRTGPHLIHRFVKAVESAMPPELAHLVLLTGQMDAPHGCCEQVCGTLAGRFEQAQLHTCLKSMRVVISCTRPPE